MTGIDPQDGDTDAVAAGSDRTDSALVARVRDGNAAAFWELMGRHDQRLFRIARSILQDEHEAEDTVQELMYAHFPRLTPSEARQAFRLGSLGSQSTNHSAGCADGAPW